MRKGKVDLISSAVNVGKPFSEMCQVIADDWNKEGKDQITGEEVWDALSKTEFPALWGSMMYEAAKNGHLIGLLLTDNTCARIFYRMVEEVDK